MKLKLLLSILFALSIVNLYAQSGVAISEQANRKADGSAILDVVSTNKGMLVPRMSNAQKNSISNPATGLLIYQTDNSPGFYYYNGSSWQAINSGGSGSGGTPNSLSVTSTIPVWNGSSLINGSLEDDGEKVGVFTGGGLEKSRLSSFDDGSGFMLIFGPSGKQNFAITNLNSNPDNGFLELKDENGVGKSAVYVNSSDAGSMYTLGENEEFNVLIQNSNGGPNNGFIGVFDEAGDEQASMYVNADGDGVVFADVISVPNYKSFTVPHPNLPDKEIWYASLEGPEAAMYIRGTSSLVNGEATIELPEHFSSLASEKSITVITTPLSATSMGLAVVKKNTTHFVVKELMSGTGNYEFDWEIKSIRKGFEDFEVIRQKRELGGKNIRKPESKGADIKAKTRE